MGGEESDRLRWLANERLSRHGGASPLVTGEVFVFYPPEGCAGGPAS